MKTINWSKGFFDNTYKLFYANTQIGSLRNRNWTSSADAFINGKKLIFKMQGFFNPITLIIDADSNMVIGKITYGKWKSNATIEYSGKVALLKSISVWSSIWSLKSDDNNIFYYGSSNKGRIELEKDDDILLATGLFARNYFLQMFIIVIVAVVVPLWINVISK